LALSRDPDDPDQRQKRLNRLNQLSNLNLLQLAPILSVIRRRWWLILIPAAVATVLSLSGLRAMVSPPLNYTAGVRFTASAKPATGGTFQDQSYTPWLASEYAVNSIAAWMRTESFSRELSAVLEKRGKTISAETLRGVVTSDSARSIMTFYLTSWPNPDEARLIGQSAIEVLTTRVDAYFPQFAAAQAVIVPLDEVLPAPIATPITARLAPLVRIGIGLALGLVLAFALEFLDSSIRNRGETEALGLSVIGEIPVHR
jgi:capsular polysaccharide biosynthesis protein